MNKNTRNIKDGLSKIIKHGGDIKASEVIAILTDAHKDLLGNESLCKGIVKLTNSLSVSRMVTADIEIFAEEVINVTTRHKDVNFGKFVYLDWMRYLDGEDDFEIHFIKNIDPHLEIGDYDKCEPEKELSELLVHSGKAGAASVYGILYFLAGK